MRLVEDYLRPLSAGGRPAVELAEFVSPKLEVCDFEGRGRGLRVSAEVACGEVLLLERPTLECGCVQEVQALGHGGGHAETAWRAVPQELRRRALALQSSTHAAPERAGGVVPISAWARAGGADVALPSPSWLAQVFSVNAMALADVVQKPDGLWCTEAVDPAGGVCLFSLGALLNHSCAPTASRLPLPGCLVVRASRPLAPGEEVTVSYIDVRKPLQSRHRELRSKWGFDCGCERCALEEDVWTAKDMEQASRHWRLFEQLAIKREGDEADLVRIVGETARITDRALERYLASGAPDAPAAARCATELGSEQRAALCAGREPKGRVNAAAANAFRTLRSLLLASYCLAPSFEYANGLRCTGRAEQSLDVWGTIVASVREVMPNSVVHTANALQRAVVAAEAGRGEVAVRAMLLDAVRVVDAAYGGGAETAAFLLDHRLRDGTGVARRLGESLEAARKVFSSAVAANSSGVVAPAAPPAAARPPAEPPAVEAQPVAVAPRAPAAPPAAAASPDGESRRIDIAGKQHVTSVRLERSGACAVVVVVEVADVEDAAALPLEASPSSLRIGGAELALPCRIDVESATTRWSKRSRALRFTASVQD